MNHKLLFGSALLVFGGLAIGPVCQTTEAAEPLASAPSGENAQTSTAERAGLSVSLNFVNLGKDAKVIGISKASSLGNMQNLQSGNTEAAYTFDPTDAAPTLVVDLGSRQSLDHVTCAYKAPAGRLDLFLVDNPNARAGEAVSLNYVTEPSLQPVANETAAKRLAVYTITTAGEPNVSRLSADMGGQSGRYLIAEFHPLKGQHRMARGHDGKDYKDFKDSKDAPITDSPVAGIASFGDPAAAQAVPLLPLTAAKAQVVSP